MFSLFKRKPEAIIALRLYDQMVASAREPEFYTDFGVPDTLDGRFECIAMHVFALIFRLKNETGRHQGEADRLAQYLFDAMFRDIERSLREMGVGDLGVPKKMKMMMKSFNGRCYAYAESIQGGTLEEALRRNLYGTVPVIDQAQVDAMAVYLDRLVRELAARPYTQVMSGAFARAEVEIEYHEKAA